MSCRPSLIIVLFAAMPILAAAQNAEKPLTLRQICFKPYIAGTRPEDAFLSADGKSVFYHWDEKAGDSTSLWMMRSDGRDNHRIADSLIGDIAFSPDGKTIACTRSGDIFLTDSSCTRYTRLTKTSDNKYNLSFSPDGKWLLFGSGDKIMAMKVGGDNVPGLIELAQPSGKDSWVQLEAVSKDGRRILFSERNRDSVKEYLIPQYNGKDVTTRPVRTGSGTTRVGFAPFDTGSVVWVKLPGNGHYHVRSTEFSPDGRSALIDWYSADFKSRDLYIADTDSGKSVRILHETDTAWIEGGAYEAHWMPDGRHIVYTSEREGWNHLYMTTPDGKHTDRLTRGEWEIRWYALDPSGKTIYLLANKDDHAQWQLFSCDVGTKTLMRISSREGTYDNTMLSKDGSFILASYSNLGVPEELVRVPTIARAAAQGAVQMDREIQLTWTTPPEFTAIKWTIPEIVQFKARDGKMVPAFIYKPAHFDPSKKYPVVVFVHGAGYIQNVYRGWSYYAHEYMFHTLLNRLGYVVFEVEYRGSAGLGRDFRTDVSMHLGGKDIDDEVDGIDYLTRLGYIDSSRVGIYGGSYGGFLTLMALFRTDRFACGVAMRAVTSWENYFHHNPWYTEPRLGKPADHPDAYRISSPLTYADSLNKPLLIVHGMVDDNVFFQDAVQLIDKLEHAGKKFELMIYPSESHAFTQPESWYDEYTRIEEFFNRNLRPEGTR